jgi:putative ABC transport system permease protein
MDVMARHAKVYDWPGWGVVIKPLRKDLLGSWPDRRTILLLQGAVLLVMLIACSNAANLLLTRSTSREREIAIRLALGGSPSHVIRQLLVESVLLASLGGAAGIALAALGIEGLNAWLQGQRIVLWSAIRLDPAVLGFSLLLSLITGVVFGMVPAWRMAKANIQSSLGRATRGATHAITHRRTVDVLAVAEMGLAVVLLIGAGLLVRSLPARHPPCRCHRYAANDRDLPAHFRHRGQGLRVAQ